ncbi:hypothetical protein EG329_012351 [Mollisiaceae sp. DMI_Dod_QoI]|nr:hypothetical protein EG329_012351 [Helotiales sp. DMI_Dod_QoI]
MPGTTQKTSLPACPGGGVTESTPRPSYNTSDDELQAKWEAPNQTTSSDYSTFVFQVYNTNSMTVNSGMQSSSSPPIVGDQIKLATQASLTRRVSPDQGSEESLAHTTEGSDSADGDMDDKLADKLAAAETSLEQLKEDFEAERARLDKELRDTERAKSYIESALQERDASHENDVKKLSDARDMLDNELRSLKNEKKSVDRALETTTAENQKYATELNQLEDSKRKVEDELATLNQTNQTLVLENSKLKDESGNLRKRVEILEDEADKQGQKNAELEDTNTGLYTKIEQLGRDLQGAKQKLTKAENSKAAVERDLDVANGQIGELEIGLGEERQEAQRLTRELSSEKSNRKAAEIRLRRMHEQRMESEFDAQRAEGDLNAIIFGLEIRVECLETDAKELDQEKWDLKKSLLVEKGARAGLKRENERFEIALHKANNDLSDAEDQVSALASELWEAGANLKNEQNRLAQAKGKLANLLKELDDEKSKHTETRSKLDSTRRNASTKAAKLEEKLRAAQDAGQGIKNEQAKLAAQSEQDKRKIDALQSDLDRTSYRVEEEKIKVARLNDDKAFQRELAGGLQVQLNGANATVASLNAQVTSLNQRVRELENSVSHRNCVEIEDVEGVTETYERQVTVYPKRKHGRSKQPTTDKKRGFFSRK